jgi:hypothetical protein
MTEFIKISNPNSKGIGARPMFGPAVSKYKEGFQQEEEKPAEFVCEVCGLVAKSRIGLVGHKRIHKE